MSAAGVVALVGLGLAALWVVPRTDPAWTISLAVALMVFNSHWGLMGIPLPLDRVLALAGVLMVALRIGPARDRPPIKLGLVHVLLAMVIAYATLSSLWSATFVRASRFQILDGLGVIPFVLFAVAPVVYRDDGRREVLLRVLVGLGLYLGATTLLAAAKADSLVWPGYILDPNVGIHAERARGPFLEAVANGVALIACSTAAAMALTRWRDPLARSLAWIVIALGAAGVALTYTRSVWLGGALGVIAVLLAYPDLTRRVLPVAAAALAALGLAVAAVPGFGAKIEDRFNARGPVWVREHTNNAALRMIEQRPVFGFGWNSFVGTSRPYFRDIPGTKLTGYNEPVHNVVLLRGAELGIVGAALWVIALGLAFGAPLFRRVGGTLRIWQRGYVVVLVALVVAAAVTPLGIPFPLALVAVWSGLLLAPDPERDVAPG